MEPSTRFHLLPSMSTTGINTPGVHPYSFVWKELVGHNLLATLVLLVAGQKLTYFCPSLCLLFFHLPVNELNPQAWRCKSRIFQNLLKLKVFRYHKWPEVNVFNFCRFWGHGWPKLMACCEGCCCCGTQPQTTRAWCSLSSLQRWNLWVRVLSQTLSSTLKWLLLGDTDPQGKNL